MKAAVYMKTLGCRLNEAELVSWGNAFEGRGHGLVARPEDANLIILNTCAVTAEAARKSRKLAAGLHRRNPSAKLVLTGCMAELEPERAAAIAGADLIVSNHDKEELVTQVLDKVDLAAMPLLATEAESQHLYPEHKGVENPSLVQIGHSHERTRAFIKVQDGCRNKCSYCVVTIARGDERSRAIASLIDEINALHAKGYKEAVLTGVHLGGYGHDLGTNLSALVRAVLAGTTIERVRLSSLEPWDLPEDFGSLWQDPRLMPHLHLPLQSGSDTVLRRMARRCFTAEYRQLVHRLRQQIPALNVTTDIIVGFPGETEEEFQDSLRFSEEMGFGHMHIFGFSAREGTRAATLPGRVAGPLIKERSRQMHRLAAVMKEQSMRQYLGTTRSVLWESAGDTLANGTRQYLGYTDNYLRVETFAPTSKSLRQSLRPARLSALQGAPIDRYVVEL